MNEQVFHERYPPITEEKARQAMREREAVITVREAIEEVDRLERLFPCPGGYEDTLTWHKSRWKNELAHRLLTLRRVQSGGGTHRECYEFVLEQYERSDDISQGYW